MEKKYLFLSGLIAFASSAAFSDTIKYTNRTYVGQTKKMNGKKVRHGKGVMTCNHTTCYYGVPDKCEGTFVDDVMTYASCSYDAEGSPDYKYEYVGEWAGKPLDERFHGKGTLKKSGLVYTGSFEEGHKTKGMLTFPNGDIYDGDFRFDQNFEKSYEEIREGQGTFTWDNGTKKYKGTFLKNQMHGLGRYTSNEGVYEGDFTKNARTGIGTFTTPDGTRLVGEFLNTKLDGRGTIFAQDGSIFMGTFKEGKKNGFGVLKNADGSVVKGKWTNDNFETVIEYIADFKTVSTHAGVWTLENIYETTFKNGDQITEAKTNEEWSQYVNSGVPAYIRPPRPKLGLIYNMHVLNDPRGIAPEGWRVPKAEDYTKLCDAYGGKDMCGNQLQSDVFWRGVNSSGFSILDAGYFSSSYIHYPIYNESTGLWTSSIANNGLPLVFKVYYSTEGNKAYLSDWKDNNTSGYFIRLIKK